MERVMKIVLYGFLAVFPLGLLVGCEESIMDDDGAVVDVLEQENIEPNKEDNTAVNMVDKVENVNDEEYILKYIDHMKVVEESIFVNSEVVTEMSRMINDNPQILYEQEFIDKTNRLTDAMESNYLSTKKIIPPIAFENYHMLILGSLEEYSNGAKLFGDGIWEKKPDYIDESLEHFITAINLSNEATKELIRLTEIE